MTEDFKIYFYTKFIQCLIYDKEIYNFAIMGKYDFYIFDELFFATLIDLIPKFLNNNILEEKSNVYGVLSYFRTNAIYSDEETKKEYYEIINNMIIKLNCQNCDNSDDFYLYEIAKRFNCFGKKISFKDFEIKKDFVKKSLGYDFIFLIYHLDEIDEETFDNSIESLLNDEYYFASLNAILYECPEILENETFKRRIKKVIDLNKKNLSLLLDKSFTAKIYILKNNLKYSSLCI